MRLRSYLVAGLAVSLFAPFTVNAQNTNQPSAPVKSETKNVARKTQAELSAKKVVFGTVSATDSSVTAARKVEDLPTAKTLIGKEASFVGTVVTVFQPRSNSVVLLNFARDYKTALTAAILAKDFAAFPDLNLLSGKKILITGKVIEFRGQPEVSLTKPSQIKLIP